MSDKVTLAFPTIGSGGLDCERSGHFGHCDTFTLVDVTDGEIGNVSIVSNPPHAEGGCLTPVALLASHNVTAILVAGMGARPLAGFRDAGISVYFDNTTPKVVDALALFVSGEIEVMDERFTCQGH